MPRMNGIQLLTALQTERLRIVPIVLTGCGDLSSAVEGMKRGAFDFLLKPVNPERLREVLRRAAEHARAWQQRVMQQERLHALGTMASGVVHDFNNLLCPIIGYTELLLSDPKVWNDREQAALFLQTIHTAAHDAASTVQRLREFYREREEAEMPEYVSLPELVEQALALTQPKWKYQAQANGVSIRIATDLQAVPPIPGNGVELREVLSNLIFNAVDAMPQGGAITIRTRMGVSEYERMGDKTPTLPNAHTPPHVVLEVSDTGVGMSAEVRRRCLEPFFTTKGAQGSGLGLSVVCDIVQRHGGTIEIESAVGRGTCFIIRLPIAGGDPKPSIADAAQGSVIHEDKLRRDGSVLDDERSCVMGFINAQRQDVVRRWATAYARKASLSSS